MWVGDERHAPSALPPRKKPGTHCIGGWVGPRTCLDERENLAAILIRFPDPIARSEWLYLLRHPGPRMFIFAHKNHIDCPEF